MEGDLKELRKKFDARKDNFTTTQITNGGALLNQIERLLQHLTSIDFMALESENMEWVLENPSWIILTRTDFQSATKVMQGIQSATVLSAQLKR